MISAALVGVAASAIGLWFDPQARLGIWAGLGVAWTVQAAAFAILVAAAARRPKLVVAGWTAGTILRLGTLALVAWLCLGEVWSLPPEPTLLALVATIFGLLLLEPVIFRQGTEVR